MTFPRNSYYLMVKKSRLSVLLPSGGVNRAPPSPPPGGEAGCEGGGL